MGSGGSRYQAGQVPAAGDFKLNGAKEEDNLSFSILWTVLDYFLWMIQIPFMWVFFYLRAMHSPGVGKALDPEKPVGLSFTALILLSYWPRKFLWARHCTSREGVVAWFIRYLKFLIGSGAYGSWVISSCNVSSVNEGWVAIKYKFLRGNFAWFNWGRVQRWEIDWK